MTIDDIKHCLLTMIDCEVCEECNLYGTTGTDHCEHDCVDGALHIIDKYQKIKEIVFPLQFCSTDKLEHEAIMKICEVIEDGNDKRRV
jgi:hypothetical protein